jgi:hypothetical protein
VESSCERGNETSGSIKCWTSIECLHSRCIYDECPKIDPGSAPPPPRSLVHPFLLHPSSRYTLLMKGRTVYGGAMVVLWWSLSSIE